LLLLARALAILQEQGANRQGEQHTCSNGSQQNPCIVGSQFLMVVLPLTALNLGDGTRNSKNFWQ
jgi:hypothetical protein